MPAMPEITPFPGELPPAAAPALEVVQTLRAAGHHALLAGGCVRDLLRGQPPEDYDVATDAPPPRVQNLFRPTRLVGAAFGVVLVKRRDTWVEVATFRADGPYEDGRRPVHVHFCDARRDAQRRDFTINGMFLDPAGREIIDYVDGQRDLTARLVRAIGDPAERFEEDHLRILRAARFAARLGFEVEPQTLAAMRLMADRLERVAAERVREELEKMLCRAGRTHGWRLMRQAGLLPHLWAGSAWTAAQAERVEALLDRLPERVEFELVFSLLLHDRAPAELHEAARRLTLSNEQREAAAWIVERQAALDDPARPSLAELKRCMAHPAFASLRMLAAARHGDAPDGPAHTAALATRLASIPPDSIAPRPLVGGADLERRRVPHGPIYARILEQLYTRQLDDELRTREEALAALDALLAQER